MNTAYAQIRSLCPNWSNPYSRTWQYFPGNVLWNARIKSKNIRLTKVAGLLHYCSKSPWPIKFYRYRLCKRTLVTPRSRFCPKYYIPIICYCSHFATSLSIKALCCSLLKNFAQHSFNETNFIFHLPPLSHLWRRYIAHRSGLKLSR